MNINYYFYTLKFKERRKLGSLGWNISYDFNESDLETSLTILENVVNTYKTIPWENL